MDKLVGSAEQLRSKEDDRGSTVTDFLVLLCCERDEDTGLGLAGNAIATHGRVRDVEQGKNGGTVVGNGHITDVVNEHLVETIVSLCDHAHRPETYPTGPSEDLRIVETVWHAVTTH